MSRSFIAFAAVAATVAPLFASAAVAATISRETLERRLLDSCVYSQFQVKDVDRARMIENCRCATRTAMKTIEGEEFDAPARGLTGPQTVAIRSGIEACFKR